MDEPIKKAGQYPNVAIMAGTDPEEVKKQYGVNSSVFDEPTWEPARVYVSPALITNGQILDAIERARKGGSNG